MSKWVVKLGQSRIHKYAKSRVGFSCRTGVSPYQVACTALEKDGRPQPSATTWKSWVLKNADYILSEVAKLPPEEKAKPKKQSPEFIAKIALAAAKRRGGRLVDKSPDPIQKTPESRVKAFHSRSILDPVSDEFLSSFEWRSLRMMALKQHGATCQCCGASPKTGAVMHVDHIKPRKLFPQLALDLNNLQVLCGECNHGKGNWDQTDWREATAKQVSTN